MTSDLAQLWPHCPLCKESLVSGFFVKEHNWSRGGEMLKVCLGAESVVAH